MSEEEARSVGEEDVYIFVGERAQLNEDATQALADLADALSSEGAEVSGFLMEDSDALFGMMGGGGMVMLPHVRVNTGPISVATGGCAVDVVIKSPIEPN